VTLRPEWKERFTLQQKTLESMVGSISEEALHAHPQGGKWGAFEHLAHLSHYQEITLARLADLIAGAATTDVTPYRSEEDPEFLAWCALPTKELMDRYHTARHALLSELQEADIKKVTHVLVHPTYGRLDVAGLIDFFLHHEAHHLYQVFRLASMAAK
jgi:DinB superfamily